MKSGKLVLQDFGYELLAQALQKLNRFQRLKIEDIHYFDS